MAIPQQELFTAIRGICVSRLGGDHVFEVLPPDGTPYPFIYVGEQGSVDDLSNKTVVFAEVRQTIHVFHNDMRRRGDVSAVMDDLLTELRRFEYTKTFRWRLTSVSSEIRVETVGEKVLHGILDVKFKMK